MSPSSKIIITGPGRSGTTFLVQLLTRLSFDTGFEPYRETYVDSIRAGAEYHADVSGSVEEQREQMRHYPYILKAPEYGGLLKEYLTNQIIEVEHVIIPVRDLEESARSRLGVGLRWLVDNDQMQVDALAWVLGRTVEACVLFDVPMTFMQFPRLVRDIDYCYNKLSGVVKINRRRFNRIFSELADPDKIQTK